MTSIHTGSSLVRLVCKAMLLGIAFFSVAPTNAAIHVLKFTVPPGFAASTFYLDDPSLNGKPTAKLTVTQRFQTDSNDHVIGVWFNKAQGPKGMWAVINEDRVAIPPGAGFNVLVGTHATVNASAANSVANLTFFATATGKPPFTPPPPVGKKTGFLFFSHNWQPFQTLGTGTPVYSHQGLGYNFYPAPSPLANKWYIANLNAAAPVAASYFVFDASTTPKGATVFGHTSVATNINVNAHGPEQTFINNAVTNNLPNAVLFITPISDYNKGVGVFYNTQENKWTIFNEDNTAFAAAKSFNVMVFPAVIP